MALNAEVSVGLLWSSGIAESTVQFISVGCCALAVVSGLSLNADMIAATTPTLAGVMTSDSDARRSTAGAVMAQRLRARERQRRQVMTDDWPTVSTERARQPARCATLRTIVVVATRSIPRVEKISLLAHVSWIDRTITQVISVTLSQLWSEMVWIIATETFPTIVSSSFVVTLGRPKSETTGQKPNKRKQNREQQQQSSAAQL